MHRRLGIGLLLLLGAVITAYGCSNISGTAGGNQPPETTLWVTGDLDTVRHQVRFFWDGQDTDGKVELYEIKWIYESGAGPGGIDSTGWVMTDRTDSLFVVFVPDGVNMPTFTVRAIDDQGERDPTPARQEYRLKNDAPSVFFTGGPTGPTFPVATLDWDATDPDGNINNASYLVWIDGSPAPPAITTENRHTFLPDLFKDAGGNFVSGLQKAIVAAIDDGGRMSEPDTFAWQVRVPVGPVLLVDDLPSTIPGASTFDRFYTGVFDIRPGVGNYDLLDLEDGVTLRSDLDIRETFLLFDHVFWYAETNPNISNPLSQIELAIRDHLSAGKNLYLNTSILVGSDGALDDQFLNEVLGASGLHVNIRFEVPVTNFSLANNKFFLGGTQPFDSLLSAGLFGGIEAFQLVNPNEAAYVAPGGSLDTLNVDPWPVGVNRTYGAGQGRIVYLAFPLRVMNRSFSGLPGRSAVELNKIFDVFGMP